jgi:hypothetical protein
MADVRFSLAFRMKPGNDSKTMRVAGKRLQEEQQ